MAPSDRSRAPGARRATAVSRGARHVRGRPVTGHRPPAALGQAGSEETPRMTGPGVGAGPPPPPAPQRRLHRVAAASRCEGPGGSGAAGSAPTGARQGQS